MSKQEAIQAMQDGHKVTHRFFSSDEFIYMKNGIIYDESNYEMNKFWIYRFSEDWISKGWTIYNK